jgi:hypothetical protein
MGTTPEKTKLATIENRRTRVNVIPYGHDPLMRIEVRGQGSNVRIQDPHHQAVWVLHPLLARKLAKHLNFAAHHAEIVDRLLRTLPPDQETPSGG